MGQTKKPKVKDTSRANTTIRDMAKAMQVEKMFGSIPQKPIQRGSNEQSK